MLGRHPSCKCNELRNIFCCSRLSLQVTKYQIHAHCPKTRLHETVFRMLKWHLANQYSIHTVMCRADWPITILPCSKPLSVDEPKEKIVTYRMTPIGNSYTFTRSRQGSPVTNLIRWRRWRHLSRCCGYGGGVGAVESTRNWADWWPAQSSRE